VGKKSRSWLEKPDRSLKAAERLLQSGDNDFAVSRAYYAMLYAVQALLLRAAITGRAETSILA
jgi:uncharacterized protein (UPF0332 family)